MNVIKNQVDDLNYQVTIEISKEDYAESERKKLNDIKRRADIKGFRKGMAPLSLIQRLYGDQVLYESVNSVVSDALNNFIRDEKIRIVGEPLSSEDQPELDWKSGNDFAFKFDIAQTPELNFEVSADDKIPYYDINVTEAAKKEMKKNMLQQLGSLQEAEATKEDDYIVADLDNGEIKAEGVYISLRNVADDLRNVFVARKAGETFQVNVNEAFLNETDRAAMLKVKKEELAGINPEFNVTVVNVKTFVPAKESQETYDKMFGEGVVKSAEEFEVKIVERIESNHRQEADYRFSKDARDYFLKKADIALPEAFLKRWLAYVTEGKFTPEQIDADFDAFLADFRWQLVRGYIMQKFDLKVEEKDMQEAAESYAAYQYAMYGMGNVPQDILKNAANSILADERQSRQIEEQVEDNKTMTAIREHVTLQHKKISEDKFRELK
jgi:trigger factor